VERVLPWGPVVGVGAVLVLALMHALMPTASASPVISSSVQDASRDDKSRNPLSWGTGSTRIVRHLAAGREDQPPFRMTTIEMITVAAITPTANAQDVGDAAGWAGPADDALERSGKGRHRERMASRLVHWEPNRDPPGRVHSYNMD
jgi:hypothetical protein